MTTRLQTGFLLLLLIVFSAFAASDVEMKIGSMCDTLAAHFPDSLAPARLAIIPFTDNTGKSQGQAVAEQVIAGLQKSKKFKLVDRSEFQKAVAEIELSQSDMVDSASALKVGKIVAAPYILTGSISVLFGSTRIVAKIIRTETTDLMSSASVGVAPVELAGFTKDLLGEKGKVSSSLFRSMVAPGWGQFYTGHPVRGSICLAAFLGAAGYLVYSVYNSETKFNDYMAYQHLFNNDSLKAKWKRDSIISPKTWTQAYHEDSLRSLQNWKNYSKAYDRMIIMTIATSSIYALNLLDAVIAGAQSKRKFQLYFSGDLRKTAAVNVVYLF